MHFDSVFAKLDQVDLRLALYATTPAQVEQALHNPAGNIQALMALLSPAAQPYLETMAQRASQLTQQRFGHTINLFIPLYLSNLCANECDYCGFTMSNKIKRKVLNLNEINKEIDILKRNKFDSVLLVAGEHESKVGINYFCQVLPTIKQHFSQVNMEVQPLSSQDYANLQLLGLDGVMLYQETYNQVTYAQHHTRGKKQDFSYRLTSPDRLGELGIDKIGLGVLLGLDDWRLDALMMGYHLQHLENRYWRSKLSISLPRLRPCVGGIQPKSVLSDSGLVQLICAFRLFNAHLEISLSTRESAPMRNHLIPLGITHMSAGSSTQPGGYANPSKALEQFEISDERSVQEISSMLSQRGYQAIFKDWERDWH
ncbi:MAG: 2-iminoacetate synthase ThiH [Paraglaciecola sp.]|nr:2-iminoacetate synthase ThiH [Paraglaciecola sp.]